MDLKSFESRANNFSILRLLFATLVILSHSFELIDGNGSREIIIQTFGTISFGMLGVDGFFRDQWIFDHEELSEFNRSRRFSNQASATDPGLIVAFGFSYAAAAYSARFTLLAKAVSTQLVQSDFSKRAASRQRLCRFSPHQCQWRRVDKVVG